MQSTAPARLAAASQAGVDVSTVGAWPSSPELEVINNTQDDAALDVKPSRLLTQTFQVATPLQIDNFYIDASGIQNQETFTISIFAVADVNAGTANTPPTGVKLLTTMTATTPDVADGTAAILEFDLTGTDKIILAPSVGTTGYAVQFNRTASDLAFQWRYNIAGPDDTDLYPAGQGYSTVFAPETIHANDDFTLAFVGVVPEPASLALLALGGLLLLPRRRA